MCPIGRGGANGPRPIIIPMSQHGPNNIRNERAGRKMTQERLASLLGCDTSTVQKLEAGRIPLTLTWMRRIAGVLGCDARDLIPATTPSPEAQGRALAEKAGLLVTMLQQGELPAALELMRSLSAQLETVLGSAKS
jgi:transcriptional regulator with XRE-family HTH domain